MMLGVLSYKSKQFLWLVFKLIIVIACGYFIYDKVANNSQISFSEFYSLLDRYQLFTINIVFILLVFTLTNWLLEITKWYLLAQKCSIHSWREAAKQSLSSLTFSLITPNRIGEYGAKALYYKKKQRKKIVILNFIGNFHQLFVTIIVGIPGILFLSIYFSDSLIIGSTALIIGILSSLCILFYLLIQKNVFIKNKIRTWVMNIDFISSQRNQLVFLLSLTRYIIFSHQLYFLFITFVPDVSYPDVMSVIFSMYLIASFIPMLSLFDVVVKSSVAIVLCKLIAIEPVIAVTATTLMWILNFALPALIGSIFVFTFKPTQS